MYTHVSKCKNIKIKINSVAIKKKRIGMESGATITQISTEFMQKTKNRPIL
jgi:hypothetical protein